MLNGPEGACERRHSRPNHLRGVDVERSPMTLRKLGEGSRFAQQFGVSVRLPIGERRRPHNLNFGAALHFRLAAAPSLTLIATTVWSSKGSAPAACSATASKI